jgi:hypothetical protein
MEKKEFFSVDRQQQEQQDQDIYRLNTRKQDEKRDRQTEMSSVDQGGVRQQLGWTSEQGGTCQQERVSKGQDNQSPFTDCQLQRERWQRDQEVRREQNYQDRQNSDKDLQALLDRNCQKSPRGKIQGDASNQQGHSATRHDEAAGKTKVQQTQGPQEKSADSKQTPGQ